MVEWILNACTYLVLTGMSTRLAHDDGNTPSLCVGSRVGLSGVEHLHRDSNDSVRGHQPALFVSSLDASGFGRWESGEMGDPP